jgi:hypothetical protein
MGWDCEPASYPDLAIEKRAFGFAWQEPIREQFAPD